MGDPATKAAGFNTAVKVMRRMLAPEAMSRLIEKLPQKTQEMIRRPPPAVQWLALVHFASLIQAAEDAMGGLTHVEDVARAAIAEDLNSVYRVFIRLATPQFVLSRAAKLFSTYNQNNGTLSVRQVGESIVDLVYAGQQCHTPAYWAWQKGALWGVVGVLGLRGPTIEPVPPRDGEDAVFRVSWS